MVTGHSLHLGVRPLGLVVTSVHMPPSRRAASRDRQLAAFAQTYASEAGARLDMPFTLKGAKDAAVPPCVHVVGGDFNCHPATAAGNAWRCLIRRAVTTTGGGGACDNFLVCADAPELVNLQWSVLKLKTHANDRKSAKGLSDHDIIVLDIGTLQ